jgi:hypothetical protein
MMKIARNSSLAVTALLFLSNILPLAAQQQRTVPVEPPALRIVNYSGTVELLLAGLANHYRVTIGFEVDSPNQRMIWIELQDATLSDCLNAIVEKRPGYRWRESAGLYEVFPVRSSTPFLGTPISRFTVVAESAEQAISELMNLSEVKIALKETGLTYRPRSGPKIGERFSFTLETTTVREALHQITRATGNDLWVFRLEPGPNRFFSIEVYGR